MAETKASKPSGRSFGSTREDNDPALKREEKKAPEPVTPAPESKQNLCEEAAPDSDRVESKPAASRFDFGESLEHAVAKHFPKIIEGLMVGVAKGNASGAKVLFDALAKLAANPGKVEHQTEVGVIMSDIFGPDFDWQTAQPTEQHGLTETTEAGIDAGLGCCESE